MKFRVLTDGVKYKVQVKTLVGWKNYNRYGKKFKAKFYFPNYDSAVKHIRLVYGDNAVFVREFAPVSTKVERIESHIEAMDDLQECINDTVCVLINEMDSDIKRLQGSKK